VTKRQGRVGLLGGSFNPAHGGHRRISLFVANALQLDEVWWLVSPGNPLKRAEGMAPLPVRFASAVNQARRAPIRVSAMERELATRYTVDSLRMIRHRWPRREFVWIMGADNLAQFHLWKDWRRIANLMPIAVIARPGYDAAALASPAMVWLRRFRKPVTSMIRPDRWSAPALVLLRFDPDRRSATAIRRADPEWSSRYSTVMLRDEVTRRLIGKRSLIESAG